MRFQPVKCNMMQLTRKRVKKIHASYRKMGYFRVAKFLRFCLKNIAIIFSRILILPSAKNNFDSFPRKSWRGWHNSTRLSLDRSTVQKENLQQKYLKRKGIKDTCSLTYKTKQIQKKKQKKNKTKQKKQKKNNKKNILTYRRLNKITVQSKTMKCLSYT